MNGRKMFLIAVAGVAAAAVLASSHLAAQAPSEPPAQAAQPVVPQVLEKPIITAVVGLDQPNDRRASRTECYCSSVTN